MSSMWEEVGRGKALLETWKKSVCNCTEVGIHRCAERAAHFKYEQWWKIHGGAVIEDYIKVEASLRKTALDTLAIDTQYYEVEAENTKLREEIKKLNDQANTE